MSRALPNKTTDYANWYNELIKRADLAEHSPVRGCMIIKPYGFALWEKMKQILDSAFRSTGHVNAYFPLLIPASYLSKEANHIAGFAKECAVVTHYRLKKNPIGKGIVIDSDAQLEEPLIIRPTSETIIWHSYKNWIQSYRDLPLLINQWANVLRWEMRPRLFLRTAEILWQEGHTAHATAIEAKQEARKMLEVYTNFMQNYLAMPVVQGEKTPHERFAGADITYTIEALMQDGKALQAGTSHFLGQNFAKAFDVKFTNKEGKHNYVWGTSWGVTTRLIGALIMTHSDDKGLVLPPKLAPIQVVIIPIYKSKEQNSAIVEQATTLYNLLEQQCITTKLDDRDTHRPGWKFAEYELKGVPLCIVVGAREVADRTITLTRRDTQEKISVAIEQLVPTIQKLLIEIQDNLYNKALAFREAHTTYVDSYEDFKKVLKLKGGFVMAHWDGTTSTEKQIKAETQATIRCIPLDSPDEQGSCIYSGKPSKKRVLFAQAY